MSKTLMSRGLKGFVTRYLVILIVLLVLTYVVQNTNVFTNDKSGPVVEEEHHQTADEVGMNVEYEVVGTDLHLNFQLINMELSVEQMDKENQEGQGHIHLYVDGEKVTKIFEPNYVWEGLEPGEHLIKVELAHNNHDSYGIDETFVVHVEENGE